MLGSRVVNEAAGKSTIIHKSGIATFFKLTRKNWFQNLKYQPQIALTGVMSLRPTEVELRIPDEPRAVESPEGRETPRIAEMNS